MTHADDSLPRKITLKFLREYHRLASLAELSEANAERMASIFELAQVDKELDEGIIQIDKQMEAQENN